MEAASNRDSDVLIEVRDLVKHYGPIRAVDGISFEVRRGDVLGFLGPNGAGKTTAMKMITGFLEPDRGTVRVAGHDVATHSLDVRRKVGYLPENAPAYGEMTVRAFLEFVAEVRRVPDPAASLARAIDKTGLASAIDQTIDTLSKGFKRRVGLAQALIHDPEVLILDEPTEGLDPNQKVLIHRLIEELAPERAIVLSTHILDEAERVCSRALIISQGRILVDSKPDELIARARDHHAVRVTLAEAISEDLVAEIEALPWCGSLERRGERTVDIFPRHAETRLRDLLGVLGGVEIESLAQRDGRLDEFFREVTGGVST